MHFLLPQKKENFNLHFDGVVFTTTPGHNNLYFAVWRNKNNMGRNWNFYSDIYNNSSSSNININNNLKEAKLLEYSKLTFEC